MNRVQKWLKLWRTQHVELKSPLSVQAAEQRLTAELTPPRARFRTRPVDPDGRFVAGLIRREHRLQAYGVRVGRENSFVPVLDARLVQEDDGCRLSGTLGWARWLRVQSAVSLAFAGLWTLGSAVALILRAQGPFVPFLCVGAVCTAFGVLLPGRAGRAGWRDTSFLLDWLRETLQVR